MKGAASRALVALCDELGASWRILADGTLWIGTETWPDADLGSAKLLDEDWASGVFTVADAVQMVPGTLYNGERVQQVTHYLTGTKLRTEARVASGLGVFDRLLERVRREADFAKLWPAAVVSQAADKTLELTPDDERLRGVGGLNAVPIRHGIPGIAVVVSAGARVRVGFDGGDPKRPYAVLFDEDLTKLDEVRVVAGTSILLEAPLAVLGGDSDFVALAAMVLAELQIILDAITNAIPLANDGGAQFKTQILAYFTAQTFPNSVAATKAKAE